MKKTIITLGISGAIILSGAIYVFNPDAPVLAPPFNLTIDEPEPVPERIREQLELITAGGMYKDREINVVLTERTHVDNRAVFAEFNVRVQKEVKNLTKEEEDNKMDNLKKK